MSKQKGFTLLELAIGIGILTSLIGFGTAAYVNFNERQLIEQASKTLINNLRVAQQNALSGVKNDSGACGTVPLSGWCVSPGTDASTQKYYIYGVCDIDTDLPPAVVFSSTTPINLPRGVLLDVKNNIGGVWQSRSGNERALRFNVLGEGAKLYSTTDSQVQYCLRGTLPSISASTYRIRVTAKGEIIDDGFTACF